MTVERGQPALRRASWIGLLLVTTLLTSEFVSAQPLNTNFQLRVTGGVLPYGETLLSRVVLDNAEPVSAWNYRVFFNPGAVDLVALVPGAILSVIKNGGPPDFQALTDNGTFIAHVVTVSSMQASSLPVGAGRVLLEATFIPTSTFAGAFPLALAPAAGGPPPTVTSAINGVVYRPLTTDAVIQIVPAVNPNYALFFDADQVVPDATNELRVLLDNTGVAVRSWSYGASSDSLLLLFGNGFTGAATMIAQGGAPPDFESIMVNDFNFTHAVTVDFAGGAIGLPPGNDLELLRVQYYANPGFSGNANLFFRADLGVPVVVGPINLGSNQTPMTTSLCLSTNHAFDRGDCNQDGTFNLADMVFSLSTLFGSANAECEDSCDVNDSEDVDIADPVYMANTLFAGGPPPPGSGNCSPDATPGFFGSDLSCADAPSCP
ncbi:MAG: hypothetical protein AB7O52_08480 [Planctomycetota bacterium]